MNRIVPLILALALFMEQMDSTVISTALPAIAADIGTSPIALKLALTAYLVALAIFIPLSGWMADRFGMKKVFVSAIFVFILGSVLCAGAYSLSSFVAARFLQGMGGSMMTPLARLILVRGTEKRELVGALAWLTMPALIGPMIGAPLGGFITTYVSWHWIFLINVPIGLAGIAATLRFLPVLDIHKPGRLDVKGFLLSGFAASGIVFGMSVISLPALPPIAGLTAVLAGIIAAIAYVRHARRTNEPVLLLSLLEKPIFRATLISSALFRIGAGSTPFLLPLMLQLSFGMNPFQSGMITFVSVTGAISVKLAAASTFARFGFRSALIVNALATSATLLAMAGLTKDTPLILLYVLLFTTGFVRSLFYTGLNALSYSEIEPPEMAQATALNSTVQQLSLATGIAIAGAILEASSYYNGALTITAFHIAFAAVSLFTALGAVPIARMHGASGADVSGHGAEERV
jgi:EmrB/QacA subfamily drug resistance transporter